MNKILHLSLLFSLALYSCTPAGESVTNTPSIAPEVSECLTSTTYMSPVIVNGSAHFFKRNLIPTTSGTNVTSMILGTSNTTPIPIQFAEVQVINFGGTVIQCGVTDVNGDIKALDGTSNLNISNTAGNYTIKVLARTNHTMTGLPVGKNVFKVYASVKSDIYSNEVHAISQTMSSNGVTTLSPNIIAYATESDSAEIRGGAFNIYNDVVTTYKYLGQSTGTRNLSCLSPKLEVYWRAGFNPAQYIYPSSDPNSLGTLSFYLRGYNQLYINGGRLGNVKTQDTDHFDDAVIIHELGHRVEDACGKMDSPGNSHYGLYRIDPRLAWSEGWGNFFGAHIIRNNMSAINPDLAASILTRDGWLYYLDTSGYNDGAGSAGSMYIYLNLNRSGANPESAFVNGNLRYYDKVSSVSNPGEGHYREVSIARSLFKSTNTCTAACTNCSSCTNADYFENFWRALENDPTGIGMGKNIFPFRSSARFYSRLNQSFGGSTPAAIDSILNSNEAQQREANTDFTVLGNRVSVPYGIKLIPSASLCPLRIQPKPGLGLTTDSASDQRFSNHFYAIDLASLPGVTSINLTATKMSGSNHDIDLILFNPSYKFNEDCTGRNAAGDCTSVQKSTSTDAARADRSAGLIKQVTSINTLDGSQTYLLDIRSYPTTFPAIDSEYTYTLTDQSGGNLCPSPSF
ncbi:MAG: hypothetical protein H7328_09175 [Bdellovibrio sp.]|nr:hypothetical protein [Bdellovibrio sp.]